MKKVSACWVPRMLMDEHKQNRADVCTGLLCRLQAQPQFFVDRIVMQCYCRIGRGSITLIRRQNNKVWSGNTPVIPFLRNSRSPYLLGKSMATVFWENKGVIMTDYLSKGSTVTGAYYANELRKLHEALKSKRRG